MQNPYRLAGFIKPSIFLLIALSFQSAAFCQRSDPPSTALGDLRDQIENSLMGELPVVTRVAILKKYEQSLLELKDRLPKDASNHVEFGNELLNVSEKFFSLAAFEESDRLNLAIADMFPKNIVGAVANARLGYSTQSIGQNNKEATRFYEKSVQHFRGMDLKNDLTAAYAAMETMNLAADNYLIQRRNDEAEALYRFILDSEELSVVLLPTIRLNSASELGDLLRKKGDFDEAARRYREATSFVPNSILTDDFKDKLFMNLWELEMEARFQSFSKGQNSKDRFSVDTAGLEEIWFGLKKEKRRGAGLRVGSTLLLCYRFGKNSNDDREKILDVAKEILELFEEDPDPETKEYLYQVQSKLLRVEELKRQRSPKFQQELKEYREMRKRATDSTFVPIVSSRFPDHEKVETRLTELDGQVLTPTPAARKDQKEQKLPPGEIRKSAEVERVEPSKQSDK